MEPSGHHPRRDKPIYEEDTDFRSSIQVLKHKKDLLISGFTKENTPLFIAEHARLLDEYFQESFARSKVGPRLEINRNPYAIIALGGYGRQEQCVHSDVDLLFLFHKHVPDEAENLIREIVYPLWDIGLELGYATRSLKECLRLVSQEYEMLTPLLDARFICGISPLYSEMKDKLREKVVERHPKSIIGWLVERNHARHCRFGDSSYLLEPELKEGQGGLRDYHTLLWISRIKFNLKQVRDLEFLGILSHEEFQHLQAALSYIWNVRNRLHLLTGRKCDQLYLEHQTRLADVLNYRPAEGQEPVERFLGELHGQMDFLKEQYLMFLYELGYGKRMRPRRNPPKFTKIPGLVVRRDMLNFEAPERILEDPLLLIRIFEESDHLKIPLSAEAKRLVKEFGYLIPGPFSRSPEVVRTFERILVSPHSTFSPLEQMLSTHFLTRFIPELDGIINRIQFDNYHLYPVDRHSLSAVQILKRFSRTEGNAREQLYQGLYKELKHRKLLYWAALLHDIGKGSPEMGRHSETGARMARRVLAEKGLKPREIETVSFLIENHLFLIKTATRRDINDEETAIFCARKIRDIDHLKMLYLLTVADSIATGPKAWNDWTAILLRDLFLKVLNTLKIGELASRQAVEAVADKKAQLLERTAAPDEKQELEKFFNVMSPRYVLYTPVEQMREHIRLYRVLNNAPFVWRVARNPDANTRTVTLCAKDRPGLFSKIAGVFTLNSIDVLDVQAYTWRNQTALDIFQVNPPPDQLFEDERWQKAEEDLRAALEGNLDLAAALREKMAAYRPAKLTTLKRRNRVVLDNQSSSFFTIIEVFAFNHPGLLYRITDALFKCGLDVRVAKIATKVDQIVDVFYVKDLFGQKVDSSQQESQIRAAVEAVLD